MRVSRGGALALVLAAALLGCAPSEGADPATDPGTPVAPARPPTAGGLDYQLGGAAEVDAAVVVRDASADPAEHAYSVCYVNGFQTQPDAAATWDAHPELLLTDEDGSPVVDPDWPDEHVLDPSTPAQREGILDLLGPTIRHCAAAGYDAVEIDNLDTFTRFPAIDEDGALALARSYVELAHDEGLAIGQKNAAELAARGHEEIGFDVAVAEECAAYDECGAYTAVYGDHVLQVEYPDALEEAGMTFADACARTDRAPLMVLRDRELVAPGEDGYVRESC